MQPAEVDPRTTDLKEPDPFDRAGLDPYHSMRNALDAGAVLGDMSNKTLAGLTEEYQTTGFSSEISRIGAAIAGDPTKYAGELARSAVANGTDPAVAAIAASAKVKAAAGDPLPALSPKPQPRLETWEERVQRIARDNKMKASEAEKAVTYYENKALWEGFKTRMEAKQGNSTWAGPERNPSLGGSKFLAKNKGKHMDPIAGAVGFVTEAIPFEQSYKNAEWIEKTTGEPASSLKTAAGETMNDLANWVQDATPSVQVERLKKALDTLENDISLPSAAKLHMAESLVNESGVVGQGTLGRVLGNVGTVLDAWPVIGAFGKRALGPVAKMLAAGHMRDAREMMASLGKYLAENGNPRAWAMDVRDIAGAQMPKPRVTTDPVNMPDGAITEAERISGIRGDIQQNLNALRASNADPKTVVAKIEEETAAIEERLQGAARPAMSRVGVSPDGSTLQFDTVHGRTETDGFATRAEATQRAEELKASGVEARVREVTEQGKLVDANPLDGHQIGDFYVETTHLSAVAPVDQLAFGGRAVFGPAWLGRAARFLMPPQWLFNPKLYGRYLSNTLIGSAIKGNLQKIAAPLLRMSGGDKAYVNKMLEWAERFGEREGKTASWADVREAFPEATPTQLRGYHVGREFYDTVYEVTNNQVYQAYLSRGFKTLKAGDRTFHGKPLTFEEAKASEAALEPMSGTSLALTPADVEHIYQSGGGLLKLDRAVESTGEGQHTLVIHGHTGATLSPLARNPLEYVHGYVPRLYESPYLVNKTIQTTVDGKSTEVVTAVARADTKAEADRAAERLTQAAKGGESYTVAPDQRLVGKDRTAMDSDAIQTEDRLLFGERGTRLADVRGGLADIVDPLNMIQRTSNIVSRLVSIEDLTNHQLNQWGATFDGFLTAHGMGNWQRLSMTERLAALRKLQSSLTGKEAATAHQARTWMDYISTMSGTDPAWNGFRKAAIAGAETVARFLGKSGVSGAVSKALTRSAGRFDPATTIRSLVYFDYITARPFRQLILQASQASFVAPLLARPGISAGYLAKWPIETWNVLKALKLRSFISSGGAPRDADRWLKSVAKSLGMSPEEFAVTVREFENSGIMQGLEMHSIAGDLPRAGRTIPTTTAGRVVSGAAAPLRKTKDLLQKGFDLGEQWNLAASYVAALRIHMADNGVKTVADMTPAMWKDVGARASEYALAMNRANASSYQYGWLGLASQFLSFTHKVTMTAPKLVAGERLGGRLTRADGVRLLAGQAILFGGTGWGIGEFVSNQLNSDPRTVGLPKEAKDIISSGAVDYTIDKALQLAFDDPSLDLPTGKFLAPGANTAQTVEAFIKAGLDVGWLEAATGPSFDVAGAIGGAIDLSRYIYGQGGQTLPEATRHEIVADGILSGTMAGWSDYSKSKAAAAAGRWLSSTGAPLPVEAKWHEVWAKGLLGMSPQSVADFYAISGEIKDKEKELGADIKHAGDLIDQIVNSRLSGQLSSNDQLKLKLASELAILGSHDKVDADYISRGLEKLYLDKAAKDGVDSLELRISKFLTSGLVPSDRMRAYINRTATLTDEQREAANEWIDKLTAESPVAFDTAEKRTKDELTKASEQDGR